MKTQIPVILTATFVVLLAASASSSLAESGATEQRVKHLVAVDDSGLAVQGYDPVAFFTDGKPVKGTAEYSLNWHGAEWRFASAEHRATFKADPEKYAPAYGGYCAWGVGEKNDLFPVEIDRWKIVEGRLYLNFNAEVQKSWLSDVDGFIKKADANWPELVESKGK